MCIRDSIYGLSPQELANVPSVPATLDAALERLREGSAFLRKGDVFSEDFLETWIDYKYNKEIIPMQPVSYTHLDVYKRQLHYSGFSVVEL